MGYVGILKRLMSRIVITEKVVFTEPFTVGCYVFKTWWGYWEEIHPKVDQFFRVEEGEGKVIMDGQEQAFSEVLQLLFHLGHCIILLIRHSLKS